MVPPDALLSDFAGRTHCLTTNFGRKYGSAESLAAHSALARDGPFRVGQRLLVSKNVCHHPSNSLEATHLDVLRHKLQSHHVSTLSPLTVARVAVPGTFTDRYWLGQCLLEMGMRELLEAKGRTSKLMHDPLAAMVILDPRIINLWGEVSMTQNRDATWGASYRQGSNTFISLRHNPDLFWAAFLGLPALIPQPTA